MRERHDASRTLFFRKKLIDPDVAIRDPKGRLLIAIEIKGDMDKAGAQTLLGEARKSFAKAKTKNAHCSTIYPASCFTDAVLSQLKTEREMDLHFNRLVEG
jgi:hypothetical protein